MHFRYWFQMYVLFEVEIQCEIQFRLQDLFKKVIIIQIIPS